MNRLVDPRVLGYTTLRLAIGVTMLVHGTNRITGISKFVDQVITMFSKTSLPHFLLASYGSILPPVELISGILITVGLFTRLGLTLGGLWMVSLIFGSTLIEKYDVVGVQLIYAIIYFLLLFHIDHNLIALDAWLKRKSIKA